MCVVFVLSTNMFSPLFSLAALLLLLPAHGASPFRLASIFGSEMVLQRGAPATIWGTASPGVAVTAQLFNTATNATLLASGTAGDDSVWAVTFPAQPASGFSYKFFAATSSDDFERCSLFQFYCSGASLSLYPLAFGDVIECIGQSVRERAPALPVSPPMSHTWRLLHSHLAPSPFQ